MTARLDRVSAEWAHRLGRLAGEEQPYLVGVALNKLCPFMDGSAQRTMWMLGYQGVAFPAMWGRK